MTVGNSSHGPTGRPSQSSTSSSGLAGKLGQLHPAAIFGATAGIVTVLGCGCVLALWFVVGPSNTQVAAVDPLQGGNGSPQFGAMPGGGPLNPGTGPATGPSNPGTTPANPPVPADRVEMLRMQLRVASVGLRAAQESLKYFPIPQAGQRGSQLSWRVHILPYVGQEQLYDQFNLDEPWDGPNNKQLLAKIPLIYRTPNADPTATRIQMFVGPNTLVPEPPGLTIYDVKDGLANTLLVALANPSRAVPWTKPADLAFPQDATLASLGTDKGDAIEAVLCSNQNVTIPSAQIATSLIPMITANGGESFDAAAFAVQVDEIPEAADLVAVLDRYRKAAQARRVGAAGAVDNDSVPVLEKLRQITLGFHNYHDRNRAFPKSTGLSWRVHLLPFLEQGNLHKEFHLDEPWDSPHNQTLIAKMPSVFRTDEADATQTRFQIFAGENTLFSPNPKRPASLSQVLDGLSNTLLVVQAGRDRATVWTKPDDLPFTGSNPLDALGNLGGRPLLCSMMDGKTRVLPNDIQPETLAALITNRGGEVVDAAALAGGASRPAAGSAGPPSAGPSSVLTPAEEETAASRFKEVFHGLQRYHDRQLCYPVKDKKHLDLTGKPFLSWRVHILETSQDRTLFKMFKLDEPWDSPHNRELLSKMPEMYRDIRDPAGSTTTRIKTLVGPNMLFSSQPAPKQSSMTDGGYQTILFVQVAADRAVPWTKPDDAEFDPANPLAALGRVPPQGLYGSFGDGVVFRIRPTTSAKLFLKLATPAGGEQTTDKERQEVRF